MRIAEQDTPRFEALYYDLRMADIRENVLYAKSNREFDRSEISYLMASASRLAYFGGEDIEEASLQCQKAYEVAVRAPRFAGANLAQVRMVGELILSRLGNFPARHLLMDTFPGNRARKDAFLSSECLIRERENSFVDSAKAIPLTNFQMNLLDALKKKSSVSVSAPTSAGKSFALELELLRLLRSAQPITAIFIVPTRALIRQVSLDLMKIVKDEALQALILSSPIPPNASDRHLVFVLTQERLATLLSEAPINFSIDAIIVDEAQEVGKDKRGQTLERALRLALRRFPSSRIFFSSPLRSNPEFLLSLFGRETNSQHFIEHQSPVTQNIICLRKVKGKTKQVQASVMLDGKERPLTEISLPFAFRNSPLGLVAHHFTAADDTSIVYCNWQSSAEKVAQDIESSISEDLEDEELESFASFLEQEVHKLYKLPKLIRKGIAFHYANLPQIVRGKIEELSKERKVRFVCCTSTLLQGMNLPAKNIFVETPKMGRGPDSDMKSGDFWNLIGRAGRLSHEFNGNVFCVFSKDWNLPPLLEDKLSPINSAYEIAVRHNTGELAFYARNPPERPESGPLWAVQALASIYADRVVSNRMLRDDLVDSESREAIDEIDDTWGELRARQKLPDDVFIKNLYVHPSRLEELGAFLRSESELLSWIPLNPFRDEKGFRLRKIFGLLENLLLREGNNSYQYFAYLATAWMRGASINELLLNKLDHANVPEEEDAVNEHARLLFGEIETVIRYIYVKYMTVYLDVLRAVLIEKGYTTASKGIPPIHLFLEFGASSKALIHLMSLGLSRTSSILLKKVASLSDALDLEQCRRFLELVNLERSPLPAVCKAEIRRVRGGR